MNCFRCFFIAVILCMTFSLSANAQSSFLSDHPSFQRFQSSVSLAIPPLSAELNGYPSPDPFGTLRQSGTASEQTVVLTAFAVFALPILCANVALIGNIISLYTGRYSRHWGWFGVISGGILTVGSLIFAVMVPHIIALLPGIAGFSALVVGAIQVKLSASTDDSSALHKAPGDFARSLRTHLSLAF